jgi:Domain of unknown function (DUF4175)
MVRKTHSRLLFTSSALVCCLGAAVVTSMSRAATPRDVKDQKQQQQQQQNTQIATEDVAQRIGTMLRVMEYYQPDKVQQRKTLERVATTLVSLSREQMEEVLKSLDRAAAEPDPEKSAKELKEAHNRHIEIMLTLRELLAQYQTVSTIDQLADKLDKLAKTELELALQSTKLMKDMEEHPNQYQPNFGGGFGKGGKGFQGIMFNQDLRQLETEQSNLHGDFGKLLQKANDLKAKLSVDQMELIDKLNVAARQMGIDATLRKTDQKLANVDSAFQGDQPDRLRDAAGLQRRAAESMKDLASLLWQPKDILAALRKAQGLLDDSIHQQQELKDRAVIQAQKDLSDPPRPPVQPDFQDFPRGGKGFGKKGGGQFGGIRDGISPPMMDDRGAKEMSDQQARLALDTRDPSNLLKPFAIDVADEIDAAQRPMKRAEDALRDGTPSKAVRPQDQATSALKDARAKVADLIAQAEDKKKDPISALKDAAETIEKLLKDQIATRDQTKDADDAKQPEQLPKIAPKQKDLANRTEDLNSKPMPTRNDAKQALDKASKAMDNAAKNLQNQKAPAAVAKQNDAIKALEDAKKSFQQQIAEMEKRREDIAKLEDAAQKLDKLTKDEIQVADQAKDKSQEPTADTKDLAKKQGDLTPQAKDVAKDLDKLVPKAADKVNQSAQNMDAAQKELDKNKAKPGAQEADQAVEKLKDAQAELANKLDNLKSKELADQAAMKNANAAAAMQQLQKAMEQTKQAMKDAQKAVDQQGQKSLAQLQKELADNAKDQKLENPAVPATAAAKALSKGDLSKALQEQQQALDKFQDATPNASKAPLTPEQAKESQLPPSSAKPGDPQQAQKSQAKTATEAQSAQAKQGAPQPDQLAQAKHGDPDQDDEAKAKQGPPPGQSDPQAAQAKAGQQEHQGQAKPGQPPQALAKAGQQEQQGQVKSGQQGQSATQMAPEQKELMDLTRQLAQQQAQARAAQQSQQSNQGAMQALGQAMAGSPQGAQKTMQQAANKLGQAGKQLGKGSPGQAAQDQQQALDQMRKAMQQLQGAQAAKAKQGEGKDGKDGKGQQAKGDGKGQGKDKGKQQGKDQGTAQEKNDNKANGNRIADGKVTNTPSVLLDVTGEDTFLQLPPRQRELIRQALAGELPPEYAAQIQQYYLNISRGRSAVMPNPPPPK